MLANLATSLDRQDDDRFELLVVAAGGAENPYDVMFGRRFRCSVVEMMPTDDERIAYSAARNAGAHRAQGEHLAFCDADTVLAPSFVSSMHAALDTADALCTGDLSYLPPGHADLGSTSFEALARSARPHQARPVAPANGVRFGAFHHLVWGLNMVMRAATFARVGGFDESYLGYAGEDTDLARALDELGIPAAVVAGAQVLHQHHDSFEPPVHQFRATLANAERFYAKWGEWPMQGWLERFAELGLIERCGAEWCVQRDPTEDEIEAARRHCALPFRSATH